MLIFLHKQAATPKIRAAIPASTESAWLVAERYGLSELTVWTWRNRNSVHDRSHTAHRLQSTLTQVLSATTALWHGAVLASLDCALLCAAAAEGVRVTE